MFYKTLLFVSLTVMISVLATFISLQLYKTQVLSDHGHALEVVRNTSENALVQWTKQEQLRLAHITTSTTFSQLNANVIEQQLLNANSSPTEIVSRLLDELTTLQRDDSNHGFVLFATNGQMVVSNAGRAIKQVLHIKHYSQDIFEKSLLINTVFPPKAVKINNADTLALLMITTPIKIDGETIAVFAGLYDAADELSKITMLGRMGLSGETYLFDQSGTMTTDSRFNSSLEQIGLIEFGHTAIMNVKLFDPGTNLTSSNVERSTQRLSLMASSAIRGEQGKNTKGYRDYRGVEVIGAWRWSNELNMGIASEIDKEEALLSYYTARTIIVGLLLLIVFITIALGTTIILMSNRGKQRSKNVAKH